MKALIVFCTLIAFSWCHASDSEFPESFQYKGYISDSQGQPMNGVHSVRVRLLNQKNQAELYQHSFPKVVFDKGHFELSFGEENPDSIKKISANNSKMYIEVTVNDQLYGPLIEMQPAGHSMKSRLALMGVKDDKKLHSKGYNKKSTETSYQAVSLKPSTSAKPIENTELRKSNPYLMPVIGPVVSQRLDSLPTIPNVRSPYIEKEVNPPRHERLFDSNGRRFGTENPNEKNDELAGRSQQFAGALAATPAASINFEGLANINGVLPPDIEGVVGPAHYIQMINLSFAVYDKTGSMVAGPSNTNTLWSGLGSSCEVNNNGDAIALYDQQADRYVLTQFSVSGSQSVCFAVSTTNDPLGTYYLYEMVAQRFPDYYKLGVWSDPVNNAYYMGTNSGFPGAYDVYAIDRQSLIEGVPPRDSQFFQSFPNLLMPADQDGHLPAPVGSPGLFYTIRDGGESYFNPVPANDSIDVYEFAVDWNSPANSTFTMIHSFGPPDIAEFNWTVCGFFESSCLDQPGSAIKLDSGSWWPMQRFQYRNFGTYEMLLGTWTVDALADGDHAAPRWFELRKPSGGAWSVYQEGTHAPDLAHRWEPSISMNGAGDIALVYNILDSLNNVFAGIRFAGRQADDPLGVLRDEASLIEGSGVQTSTSNRWGDYASMDVDPVNDCSFWFTSEYLETSGGAPWQTRIGSFSFPGCVSVVSTNASQDLCTTDESTSFSLNLTGDFTGTTNLSFSDCPTDASCSFNVNPIVNPDVSSQLDVTNLAAVNAGNYQIGVTATDSVDLSKTFTTFVALNLVSDLPAASSLTAPADNSDFVSTDSRSFSWTAAADASEYIIEIATDSDFNDVVETATVNGLGYSSNMSLSPESTYYWRVSTANICGDGGVSSVFSFTTAPQTGECPAVLVKKDNNVFNFETGAQGWTSQSLVGANSWNLSTANPFTGAQHWHIDDIDTESDTVLVSPLITLPEIAQRPITMHFNNYQNMESNTATSCWDGGVLEISTDGGANFTQIQSDKMLTDPYDGPFQSNSFLFGEEGWCGDPQSYLESLVALDDYAGQTVQFRFRMATDGAVGDEGWDIEDFKIQSCATDSIFDNSFD